MIEDTPFAVEETAMKYAKVDSSQIAEIGYGEGVYGPHTLGLKFPPNKKQIAAGEAGSEYHYGGISPEMHQEFLNAESIVSYFGKNIKGRPDLYPFTKIETNEAAVAAIEYKNSEQGQAIAREHPDGQHRRANPPLPVSGAAASTQEDQNSAATESSIALAVIDATEDELLFTPGKITDAQLQAGREWYITEAKKYDIATEKQRTELKRFARPLQKLRTGIEARAKELTGATKRKIAAIDAEKRRLVQIVGGIEDEVLAPLTAWEREEEERKTRLSGIVKSLGEHVVNAIYPTISSLEETIAELEGFDVSTMQEYRVGAESAIAASLKVLKPEVERRKVGEANERELAALRAEAAARAEQDRIERVAADAVEAERKRQEAEAARVKAEAEVRAADEQHRKEVNERAYAALLDNTTLSSKDASEVIRCIAKGMIPYVTINY